MIYLVYGEQYPLLSKRVKRLVKSILGDEKYIKELYLTCNFFDIDEAPYVTINKDVIPDSFIERFK